MTRWRFLFLPISVAAGAIAACSPAGSAPPSFQPKRVVRGPFPAIVAPPAVSAEEAEGRLHEAELVLGVTIAGQSRAYPINMLTGPNREIINDVLGGRAIAATW